MDHLSLLHFFSIAELTRALAFAIAEEGTCLHNGPFGYGKSSLSAGFEVRRKYFKINDIFNTRGWSRAHECALICSAYQKLEGKIWRMDGDSPNSPMFSSAKVSRYTVCDY